MQGEFGRGRWGGLEGGGRTGEDKKGEIVQEEFGRGRDGLCTGRDGFCTGRDGFCTEGGRWIICGEIEDWILCGGEGLGFLCVEGDEMVSPPTEGTSRVLDIETPKIIIKFVGSCSRRN